MNIIKYTPEMFYEDDDAIHNILQFSSLIKLSPKDLPSINLNGLVLQLNTNSSDADMAIYFINKYKQPLAGLYYIVYTDVIGFIHSNKEALVKDKIVRKTKTTIIEIDTSLFDVLLSSFEYTKKTVVFDNHKVNKMIRGFTEIGLVKPIGFSPNNFNLLSNLSSKSQFIPTSNLMVNDILNYHLVLKAVKAYIKAQDKLENNAKG